MSEVEPQAGFPPGGLEEPPGAETGKERARRLPLFLAAPKLAVWRMALPAMAGLLVHTFYSVVDTAFVGRLGPVALAAQTRAVPVFFIMIALTAGLGSGATSAIARAAGAGRREEADRVASTALAVGLLLGLLYTAAGLLLGDRLPALLGAQGEGRRLAWDYLRVLFYGAPVFFLSVFMRCFLTGEGDARTPMLVMSGALLLNLFLDPVFIFRGAVQFPWPVEGLSRWFRWVPTLGLGVAGAALATVAAQTAGFLAYLWILFVRRRTYVRFRRGSMAPSGKAFHAILRVGGPTALAQGIMGAGFGLVIRILKPFGDLVVAGYGAGTKVDMLVVIPVFGLAGALVPVAGMFRGAGRMDLVKRVTFFTYGWSVFLAILTGVSAWLSAPWSLRLFCDDPRVIEAGKVYLGWMVFSYPLMALGVTSGRLLQGLGLGLPYLVITSVRLLLVTVPLAWILTRVGYGPQGVWGAFIAGGVAANAVGLSWVAWVFRREGGGRKMSERESP
ncbi:MAG TPA: MATE family efflux transporter [Planctomycetes bacterium]|nr:MATE family efflux transporter [Planctomycetota bacterium]